MIHHITDLDVAQAPSFDMIYDRLKALLEGKRVVTYEADFDIQTKAVRKALPSPFPDNHKVVRHGNVRSVRR